MRVVPDLNVLISSLLGSGNPAEVVNRWRHNGGVDFVMCTSLLDKLRTVCTRPKFRGLISDGESATFVEILAERAEIYPDPIDVAPVCRDPDDDLLVALARESGADGIISGDNDLTELKIDVNVWTPRQLLDILQSSESSA